MMKNICVYCGSRDSSNPEFPKLAQQIGNELANRKWGLVFGGGKVGMMGKIADAALANKGEVFGVIPTVLKKAEVAHTELTDLHETQDMHTRKALMESLSDAFLILPGGFGTLDEFFEILTWRQLGIHNKPIILFNSSGYFDGLLQFAETAIQSGYINRDSLSLFNVCTNFEECFQLLEKFLDSKE
ncbi:MAG: TIGR00730 family Rossman fold protein [Balneolaceae bacterium]